MVDLPLFQVAAAILPLPVRVVRSAKRRRTVSASVEAGEIVVLAPLRIAEKELAQIVESLRRRLERSRRRSSSPPDEELSRAYRRLNARYFEGALPDATVVWSSLQRHRFGSCQPATKMIRVSRRLASAPRWVRDYLLVHEMAHLLVGSHGPRFWALVNRYPLSERARGYLIALHYRETTPGESDVEGGTA
jgi:hypothetical protein